MRARSCDGEFSHGDISDLRGDGGFGEVFKIKFDSLLEVGEGFLFGGTETGHVVIEALSDVVGFFAVEGVMDVSHRLKSSGKAPDDKVGELKGGRSFQEGDLIKSPLLCPTDDISIPLTMPFKRFPCANPSGSTKHRLRARLRL